MAFFKNNLLPLSLMGYFSFSLPTDAAPVSPSPYILNGDQAAITDYPYLGILMLNRMDESLQSTISTFCAGTLLDDTHVLTAAHCVYPNHSLDYSELEVAFNINNIVTDIYSSQQRYAVSKIYYPDNYDDKNYKHDIAVLTLVTAVDASISRVKLWSHSQQDIEPYRQSGYPFSLVGYGLTSPTHFRMSNILQQVPVYYMDNASCISDTHWGISDSQICVTGEVNSYTGEPLRSGACQGDSGGPLLYQEQGQDYQVGIVSFGLERCGDPYFQVQSVYTEVSDYEAWIDKVLQGKIIPKYGVGAEREYHPSTTVSRSENQKSGGSVTMMMLLLLVGLGWLRRKA